MQLGTCIYPGLPRQNPWTSSALSGKTIGKRSSSTGKKPLALTIRLFFAVTRRGPWTCPMPSKKIFPCFPHFQERRSSSKGTTIIGGPACASWNKPLRAVSSFFIIAALWKRIRPSAAPGDGTFPPCRNLRTTMTSYINARSSASSTPSKKPSRPAPNGSLRPSTTLPSTNRKK